MESTTLLTTIGATTRELRVLRFPGGEPHVDLAGTDPGTVCRVGVRARTADDVLAAMCAVDALNRAGATEVHLDVPYLPGARQDRPQPGYALTVDVYARILAGAAPASVTVLDIHSPAALDRLTDTLAGIPVRAIDATPLVVEYARRIGGVAGVISPDIGATTRAAAAAAALGVPVVTASKHRDSRTGELSGFSCDPLPHHPDGRPWLVVDDICDAGGTFLGVADAVHATTPDVTLHLWVTHALLSRGPARLLRRFAGIGTTDSVAHRFGHAAVDDPAVDVQSAFTTNL